MSLGVKPSYDELMEKFTIFRKGMLELQIMSVSEEDTSKLSEFGEEMRDLGQSLFEAIESNSHIPPFNAENISDWTMSITSLLSQLRLELAAYKKKIESSGSNSTLVDNTLTNLPRQQLYLALSQEPNRGDKEKLEKIESSAEQRQDFANIIDQEYDETYLYHDNNREYQEENDQIDKDNNDLNHVQQQEEENVQALEENLSPIEKETFINFESHQEDQERCNQEEAQFEEENQSMFTIKQKNTPRSTKSKKTTNQNNSSQSEQEINSETTTLKSNVNISLDHDDPHYSEKLIIEQLRDSCVQASIALINKRSFREKILMQLQMREIRENSQSEAIFHEQVSSFLENMRVHMEEEILLLKQEEERYSRESNEFMAMLLAHQKDLQSPLPIHKTPENLKMALTPSQIAEQKDRTDLENMFNRLEHYTPNRKTPMKFNEIRTSFDADIPLDDEVQDSPYEKDRENQHIQQSSEPQPITEEEDIFHKQFINVPLHQKLSQHERPNINGQPVSPLRNQLAFTKTSQLQELTNHAFQQAMGAPPLTSASRVPAQQSLLSDMASVIPYQPSLMHIGTDQPLYNNIPSQFNNPLQQQLMYQQLLMQQQSEKQNAVNHSQERLSTSAHSTGSSSTRTSSTTSTTPSRRFSSAKKKRANGPKNESENEKKKYSISPETARKMAAERLKDKMKEEREAKGREEQKRIEIQQQLEELERERKFKMAMMSQKAQTIRQVQDMLDGEYEEEQEADSEQQRKDKASEQEYKQQIEESRRLATKRVQEKKRQQELEKIREKEIAEQKERMKFAKRDENLEKFKIQMQIKKEQEEEKKKKMLQEQEKHNAKKQKIIEKQQQDESDSLLSSIEQRQHILLAQEPALQKKQSSSNLSENAANQTQPPKSRPRANGKENMTRHIVQEQPSQSIRQNYQEEQISHAEMMQQMYRLLQQRKEAIPRQSKSKEKDQGYDVDAFLADDHAFLKNVPLSPPPMGDDNLIEEPPLQNSSKKTSNFGWKG